MLVQYVGWWDRVMNMTIPTKKAVTPTLSTSRQHNGILKHPANKSEAHPKDVIKRAYEMLGGLKDWIHCDWQANSR